MLNVKRRIFAAKVTYIKLKSKIVEIHFKKIVPESSLCHNLKLSNPFTT